MFFLFFFFQLAKNSAHCDYGVYVGASKDNAQTLVQIGGKAAALKMYLNETFTTLKLDSMSDWQKVSLTLSLISKLQ